MITRLLRSSAWLRVPAWTTVAVIAKFTDFTGTFVFHCHILEHEDLRLMGKFNVQ